MRGDDTDLVVLLDEHARPIGTAPKGEAHTGSGLPHLAFSLVLLDDTGTSMLVQQRSEGAQHFSGAWSNTCCSHPRPSEDPVQAALRRVGEELGMSATDLRIAGSFWYRAADPASGRVENEHDVVIVGTAVGAPRPDPDQVADTRWWPVADHARVDDLGPITPWFRDVLRIAFAPVDPGPATTDTPGLER